jgi:hypothetical protein
MGCTTLDMAKNRDYLLWTIRHTLVIGYITPKMTSMSQPMEIDSHGLLLASLNSQHLLEKAPCDTVVSDLCGLQAQFASNPKHALRVRGNDFGEDTWEDGLVKIWSFREISQRNRKRIVRFGKELFRGESCEVDFQ